VKLLVVLQELVQGAVSAITIPAASITVLAVISVILLVAVCGLAAMPMEQPVHLTASAVPIFAGLTPTMMVISVRRWDILVLVRQVVNHILIVMMLAPTCIREMLGVARQTGWIMIAMGRWMNVFRNIVRDGRRAVGGSMIMGGA